MSDIPAALPSGVYAGKLKQLSVQRQRARLAADVVEGELAGDETLAKRTALAELQVATGAPLGTAAMLDPKLLEPPVVVVEKIAWSSMVTVLAGREGCGKSTITREIALRSPRGRRWLCDGPTDKPTGAGVVVWFRREEAPGHLGAHLLNLSGGDKVLFNLADCKDPSLEALVWCRQYRPTLVVRGSVDCLSAFVAGTLDSGDAQGWTAAMRPLVKMSNDFGAAVLMLHHARKSDGEYRDSTAIGAAAVDVVIEVERPEDDGAVSRKLRVRKTRIEGAESFAVTREPGIGCRLGEQAVSGADAIVEWIKVNQGRTRTAVVNAAYSGRRQDGFKLLPNLHKQGIIEITEKPEKVYCYYDDQGKLNHE